MKSKAKFEVGDVVNSACWNGCIVEKVDQSGGMNYYLVSYSGEDDVWLSESALEFWDGE